LTFLKTIYFLGLAPDFKNRKKYFVTQKNVLTDIKILMT
jgi:hypothetical protein